MAKIQILQKTGPQIINSTLTMTSMLRRKEKQASFLMDGKQIRHVHFMFISKALSEVKNNQ